ncbi:DUF2946 domain-containing protein [Chromobacterium violaceum]|uniref:Protein of uncharacterized function (DUF2946) n=2 Tax=Chromobacterium violaceum TaxID=536 RepID=A0A3S4LNL7_CHRVL|nr:DUF2946 family protein [Chromobacterium violaceum]SUX88434.1 Protein of uncharacterised function (DUF2946) [Chromobacterium violaceum]VEB44950.1 Protein of uncharacterised function (DUF2946) [Chromobacterium violaceum]
MMDEMVLAALAKWPNVPAVFGWLRLDARGQWWIKDARLQHEGMVEFFNRNYSRDGQGRCYVQNGPQKVYVQLDAAPLAARRTPKGWSTVPYDDDLPARAAWLTPDGMLLLEIGGELAVVDDRDLAAVLEEALPDWDGDAATLPVALKVGDASLPLAAETLPALQARYGIVARPR